jgi:hypothetical protein
MLSDYIESVSANTSYYLKYGSLICSIYCMDSPYSTYIFIGSIHARWLKKIPILMQSNLPLHLWRSSFLTLTSSFFLWIDLVLQFLKVQSLEPMSLFTSLFFFITLLQILCISGTWYLFTYSSFFSFLLPTFLYMTSLFFPVDLSSSCTISNLESMTYGFPSFI